MGVVTVVLIIGPAMAGPVPMALVLYENPSFNATTRDCFHFLTASITYLTPSITHALRISQIVAQLGE